MNIAYAMRCISSYEISQYISKRTTGLIMTQLITKAGDYRTRNGSRVTVHEVNGDGTFAIKGSVWKMFRGKLRPRGLNTWKPCGHNQAYNHSDLDIVAEWGGVSEELSIGCNCYPKQTDTAELKI
ncbi:hypothetical protein P678_0375 [Acinetobacter baumannii UH7807]|uniref:Uncharacterized protein n=5 Tax=Acinetobacter baumannii TaxID=470 RepID=A0AAP1FBQ0_ACIBA|nr:hypothetical protein AM435_00365 [Acinetobacter baumannii]EGT88806.1 hypothetical protein ABNIH2_18970 [Acinetobacter baumannii ABNIH2]EGT99398.1 hypothetical protein ABNIH4_16528 [Acinetobacter baumannii ABNIH4]EGU01789.1 hypothetical protein ABNIH3_02040 [Acinetobacter baumannii ABNIH3]EKP49115.1 hypothetical protein ACINNAV2_2726 [Acinetobacter baumannii Naval-2]ELW92165.1 hypothetical protein ACINNAV78_2834 [Acinetobacter baumannii Naval-78]EMT82208.1 hypothetical protein ABNIH25_18875